MTLTLIILLPFAVSYFTLVYVRSAAVTPQREYARG
jgi:hypothetical protein